MVPFRGKPLARHTLELAAGMDFSGGIFFVSASDEVAALAAGLDAVTVLRNAAAEKGRRESMRLGLEAALAANAGTEHFLFFPCDQPFLDAETVKRILDARRPGCIVEPRYQDPGNPVRQGSPSLFSKDFREELLSLGEGETPKLIKSRHPKALIAVEVSSPLVLEDIDDEETLRRLELSFPV